MADESESEDFAAILAEFEQETAGGRQKEPKIGEKVTGTILSIGEQVAFVDLGAKSEGAVDLAELRGEDGELSAGVGDPIEATVSAVDEGGGFVLSVRLGRGEAQRSELRQAWEQRLPVEGLVTGVNKGGAEVEVGGLQAFCPVSQLDSRYVADPAEFVGQRLIFRIERYEEKGRRSNIVLSRRRILEEEAAALAAETRASLEVGSVVEGRVTSVTTYGAFVDLGGLEGLLHVSEMSYARVTDPREILRDGQILKVQVLKIEPGKKPGSSERISLSTRALESDPWDAAVELFAPESVAEGRVTRLESFGAFVELAPGVEGLVHVSRLGRSERVRHPRDVLALGQTVRVEVVGIEKEKRRISLALKTAATDPEEKADLEEYRRSGSSSEGFGSLGDFFKKSRTKSES